MHDFSCTDPDEMHYDVLRERAKYLKQDEEGVVRMGGSYAEVLAEGRAQERKEGTLRHLRSLIANLGLTLEQAMAAIGVPEEERAVYRKERQL